MVCEKTSTSRHNFVTDPIDYVIEDGWMIAKETTLGADDGIGVAATLALLASDLNTGKVEGLFTISEETGMDGANAIEPGFIESKTLLNLDSEDEGQIFVGCAGGLDTTATFSYTAEPVKPGFKAVELRVFNAIGGHSGDDINKERANTVQIMARFLYSELGNFQLAKMKGGNKKNAIARDTEVVVYVKENDIEGFISRFNAFAADVRKEFHNTDPDVKFSAERSEFSGNAVDSEVAKRFIMALVAINHGVLAMSQDIAGLVETSTNLAAVNMDTPEKFFRIRKEICG